MSSTSPPRSSPRVNAVRWWRSSRKRDDLSLCRSTRPCRSLNRDDREGRGGAAGRLLALDGRRPFLSRPERQRSARPVRGSSSPGGGPGRGPDRADDPRGEGRIALPAGARRPRRRSRQRRARRDRGGCDGEPRTRARVDAFQHLLGARPDGAGAVAQPNARGGRRQPARDPGHDLFGPATRLRRQPGDEHERQRILELAGADRAGGNARRGSRARVRGCRAP